MTMSGLWLADRTTIWVGSLVSRWPAVRQQKAGHGEQVLDLDGNKQRHAQHYGTICAMASSIHVNVGMWATKSEVSMSS